MKRNEEKKKSVFKRKDSTKKISSGKIVPNNYTPKGPKNELQPDDTDIKSSRTESTTISTSKLPKPTFVPLIYRFHLPGGKFSPEDTNSAETPPFWLLLDHTLGVIWTLFSSNQLKTKLGVSQLQWGLEFLKGIRSSRGDSPKDVKICIHAIEDKLIELYAKISNSMDKDEPTASNTTIHRPPYVALVKSDAIMHGVRRRSPSVVSFGGLMENMTKGLLRPTTLTVPPPYPLSVTYEEVLARSPRSVHQIYTTQPRNVTRSDVILEEQRHLQESKSNISVSNSKLFDFLTDWRREQVNRIQNELKRLHSIEAFMGTLDKDNFQPFIDEPVASRLFEINTPMDIFTLSPKSELPKPPENG